MLFFVNPAHRARRRKSLASLRKFKKVGLFGKTRGLDGQRVSKQVPRSSTPTRSASDPARSRHTDKRPSMARRRRVRRARKSIAKSSAPRRRRRRVAVARRASAATPARRRRRVRRAFASNPPTRRRRVRRRRTFRRNPGLGSARGVVDNIVQGLKDGATVVGGQVIARKIRGAITGMLPASAQTAVKSGAGYVALTIGSAIAVSLAARKFLPAQARMAAAGAFSEAINAALAQTPIAPYLGAFGPRRIVPVAGRRPGVSAWPQPRAVAAGVSAWPQPRVVGMPANAGM